MKLFSLILQLFYIAAMCFATITEDPYLLAFVGILYIGTIIEAKDRV